MGTEKHRILLDSNVILSGLISSRGAPRLILDLLCLELPALQGVTGRFNLTEIERNIAKKAPAALMVLNEYLPRLDLEIVPVPFLDELGPFRGEVDDKDLPVLASAAMGCSDFFVTGDKKLLARIARQKAFSIVSLGPSEFLDRILPELLAGNMPKKENDR
jgi:predicted nucleic acid-binding protein